MEIESVYGISGMPSTRQRAQVKRAVRTSAFSRDDVAAWIHRALAQEARPALPGLPA